VLHMFNAGSRESRSHASVTVTGPQDTVLWRQRVRLQAAGGRETSERLEPIVLSKPGQYVITAVSGAKRAELTLAALRDHSDVPSPKSSPFGAHGGANKAARRAGLSQFRDVSGLTWRWIERKRSQWRYDERVNTYAQHVANGFTCCATLADAPRWAALPGSNVVPADLHEWRRYVRRVITDFAPNVDIWEVWNEPDLKQTFVQHPDKYLAILKATREIQQQADPHSQLAGLCAAGVTDRAFQWMEQEMKLGALQYMDLLAWHPYYHKRPEDGYYLALQRVNKLMDQYGGRKPMIFTEFGTGGVSDWALHIPWTADGWRKYDEGEQAQLLVRQCVLGLAEGAVKLYWYKWAEERIQTGPDTFGLVRADTYATPKLALIAYNQLVWQLEAASLPPTRLTMPAHTQWGYAFDTPQGPVHVLWDVEGQSFVPWPPHTRVLDLWGNVLAHAEHITLSPAPVYVIAM